MSESSAQLHQKVPRIRILDGYRGAAVLAIVGFHILAASDWMPGNEFLRALRRASFFSVEMLFIVSGFVAFLPIVLRSRLGSIRSYALRRAARIVPAYLLSLLATIVVGSLLGRGELPFGELPELGLHLLFLNHPFGVNGFGVNEVYWVLSLLVAFWVLLPLVAERFLAHPIAGLGVAVATVLVWRAALQDGGSYELFIQFPLFVADFALGMSAALLYVRLTRRFSLAALAPAALAAAVILVPLTVWMLFVVGRQFLEGEIFFFGESPALALAIPAALALTLVCGALMPRWAQWPLANPVMSWIGQISYGIFLFHALVLAIVVEALGVDGRQSTLRMLLVAALVLPPSVLIGWLSYRYVEEPARARARAWERRGEPAPKRNRISDPRPSSPQHEKQSAQA